MRKAKNNLHRFPKNFMLAESLSAGVTLQSLYGYGAPVHTEPEGRSSVDRSLHLSLRNGYRQNKFLFPKNLGKENELLQSVRICCLMLAILFSIEISAFRKIICSSGK